MAFLKFEDIDKSFGENNVIRKFNLEVEKGKFIVLLGLFQSLKFQFQFFLR